MILKKKKNNKKNNPTATVASTLLTLATIIVVVAAGVINTAIATTTTTTRSASFINENSDLAEPKAPMAVSEDGNNIYIVWWTNKTGGNWEVMFRASNDSGATFGDKINLSNSSEADSQNAEIVAAAGDSVFVSWWETNPMNGTSESVLRVSTDAGQTFGPLIMLGTNGTISTIAANTSTTTAAPVLR
jgi:hypothetical protein